MSENRLYDLAVVLRKSDWWEMFPAEVKTILLRAKLHGDNPMPAYAIGQVRYAIKVARTIEQRLEKDLKAPVVKHYTGRSSISHRKNKKHQSVASDG